MKFENDPIEWKNEGITPSQELQDEGFKAGYKPPAGVFNWFWNRMVRITTELQEKLLGHAAENENAATAINEAMNKKLDKIDYTAADVLAKVKTVDGEGSGLDADTLDGKHASEFMAGSTHNHDELYAGKNHNHALATASVNGFMGAADKVKLDGLVEEYDLYIRTQSEFEALIASPTWLDAVSVCFVGNGGALRFTRSDGLGCKIPATVKRIKGDNSATIAVSNFAYNVTTNAAALWYQNVPQPNETWIKDISVSCSNDTTFGFANCCKLINCHVQISSLSTSVGFYRCHRLVDCGCTATGSGQNVLAAVAFSECTLLENCVGAAHGKGPAVCGSYSFHKCERLSNCAGTAYGKGPEASSVYHTCKYLLNCKGNSGDTSDNGTSVTYNGCDYLDNCDGTASGKRMGDINATVVFNKCKRLTSCTGTGYDFGAHAHHSVAYAFAECEYLTDCNGTASGSSTEVTAVGSAFAECIRLSNCTGTCKPQGTVGGGYAFRACKQLTNCNGESLSKGISAKIYEIAFYDCTQLINCTGESSGDGSSGMIGFQGCEQLENCVGLGNRMSGAGSATNIGFDSCNQLTNCIGTGMGIGSGYGFRNCSYMNGCKQDKTPSATAFLGGANTKVDTLTVVAS